MPIEIPMRFETEPLLWVVEDVYTESECRNFIDFIERSSPALATNNEAYRRAKDKVSVPKLVETLREMNYVYPYHQAVGFYLDRAGVYEESELRLLEEIPMEFDFYLENRMEDRSYSERWRLYFPKSL